MPRRLVDEQQPAGLAHRLEDRGEVEWRDGARIDDLGLDALLRELLGRSERAVHHPAGGDDREIPARAAHRRLSEGHQVLAVRHLTVLEREHVVVQVDDRVVVAYGRGHQALGVGGRGRHDHLQARRAHEHRGERTGMLAGPAGGEAVAGLHDQRYLDLAAGHVAEARRLVHHLVHRHQHELGHVEFDDRAVAGHRRADRHADLGGLGDRRHAHAIVTVGGDELVVFGRGHVLAEVQDVRVAAHFLVDARVDGCNEGEVGHVVSPRGAQAKL